MKYLFIDDYYVERIENLARKLHRPRHFPNNVVLRPEHRWENLAVTLGTSPLWDPTDERFKVIYGTRASAAQGRELRLDQTGTEVGQQSHRCYAESADGINWEKPFLGLCDYPEPTWTGAPIGKENNILPSVPGALRGPIHDPDDPDDRRRYKGLCYHSRALHPMVSADGLQWEEMTGYSLASQDVAQLTFEPETHRFIAMVKQRGPYGRSFWLTTSEDFVNWTPQEMVFHADQTDQENGFVRLQRFVDDPAYLNLVCNRPEERRTDIYNFPVFSYEGLYLALPVMHHWAGKHPPLYENVDSRKTVELASSRDLRQWERVAGREPFLELSPVGDGSAYDLGQIVTTGAPLRRNNELWFFNQGLKDRILSLADNLQHKFYDASAVYVTKLRLDGFVGLKGGVEWGTVVTRPVEVSAADLRVNADAWRGRVKVEILEAEENRPLSGFEADESIAVTADSVDAVVRWKTKENLAELMGRTVRLRFSIWQGELYAFWFR